MYRGWWDLGCFLHHRTNLHRGSPPFLFTLHPWRTPTCPGRSSPLWPPSCRAHPLQSPTGILSVRLSGAGVGSLVRRTLSNAGFPAVWFGQNRSGLDNGTQMDLEARHQIVGWGWQQNFDTVGKYTDNETTGTGRSCNKTSCGINGTIYQQETSLAQMASRFAAYREFAPPSPAHQVQGTFVYRHMEVAECKGLVRSARRRAPFAAHSKDEDVRSAPRSSLTEHMYDLPVATSLDRRLLVHRSSRVPQSRQRRDVFAQRRWQDLLEDERHDRALLELQQPGCHALVRRGNWRRADSRSRHQHGLL